jgi:hypothetical protein
MNYTCEQVAEHWKRERPRMFDRLRTIGRLDSALRAAVALTRMAVDAAVIGGTPLREAQYRYHCHWAFLPSENYLPELGCDPALWQETLMCPEVDRGWCAGHGVKAYRAALKAERDRLVEKIKRRLADRGNAGVRHAAFVIEFVADGAGGLIVRPAVSASNNSQAVPVGDVADSQ